MHHIYADTCRREQILHVAPDMWHKTHSACMIVLYACKYREKKKKKKLQRPRSSRATCCVGLFCHTNRSLLSYQEEKKEKEAAEAAEFARNKAERDARQALCIKRQL